MMRGVYGGFAPCMVNTVTTVGLGFFSYELGCDFYKSYVLDTHRSPTPGAAARCVEFRKPWYPFLFNRIV